MYLQLPLPLAWGLARPRIQVLNRPTLIDYYCRLVEFYADPWCWLLECSAADDDWQT